MELIPILIDAFKKVQARGMNRDLYFVVHTVETEVSSSEDLMLSLLVSHWRK